MAVPQVFNREMKRLAYLDNAVSAGYSLETNSIWTATFKMPADDPKNKYCIPFNYVEIFDGNERIDLFRILCEDLERSDDSTRFYNCEHVLATLLNDVLFQYHQYGGTGIYTTSVLQYILSHQTTKNWVLKKCDFARQFEYNWENTNLLAALFAVPNCFNGEYLWEWDTTVYPWELSLIVPSTELSNEIRYAKNMTSISKSTDVSSLTNRIYALGYGEGINQLTIKPVNNNVPYVEDAESINTYGLCATILVDSRYEIAENLKAYAEQVLAGAKDPYISYSIGAIDLHRLTGDEFSKFRPGNIVRVIDDEYGIRVRTRIVQVTKDDLLGDPGSVTVIIANKAKDIAGSISDLQNRAIIGETYAQGATNQQIYNFSDNADATHPATLKLYISDSVVRINKMVLNLEFEAFRAFERAIEGGGGQTTRSGGGSTTSSGGGQTSSGTALESSNLLPSEADGQAVHNHAIPKGAKLAVTDGNGAVTGYYEWVPSGAHVHPAHTHEIDDHTHRVSSHTHEIDPHTHEIEFGIWEGETATSATIIVDGNTLPAQSAYSDIDIVNYLSKDGGGKITRNSWHVIKIQPNTMTRIVGAVFAQIFCNSRGGGDY